MSLRLNGRRVGSASIPFAGTGGSRRQKRPRVLILFVPTRADRRLTEEPFEEITNLLRAWSGGEFAWRSFFMDRRAIRRNPVDCSVIAALDRLAERVYPEFRGRPGLSSCAIFCGPTGEEIVAALDFTAHRQARLGLLRKPGSRTS